jgi:exonuclease-1
LEKGKELMERGNVEQGMRKMIDSIDVSPDIAYLLVEELQNRGIKFIVAPYEADAQLAYLSRSGMVDFIITEDSDLLAFGAKKILYKLDFKTLNGEELCLESIKGDPESGFNWFSHCMFLSTCIMAGCDYLQEIK